MTNSVFYGSIDRMKAVVSMDDLRKNLSEIVARVMYGDQAVRVRKHKKTGVVILSEREYEELRDPRKRFATKSEWDTLFILTDKIRSRISEKNREKLMSVIDEEVKVVRTGKP